MANVINNTDLDKISQTIRNGKKDKQSLRKPVKLQGEWNLDPSKGYQFRTELSYEKGKEVIEIDSPSFEDMSSLKTSKMNTYGGCEVRYSRVIASCNVTYSPV